MRSVFSELAAASRRRLCARMVGKQSPQLEQPQMRTGQDLSRVPPTASILRDKQASKLREALPLLERCTV